MQAMSNMLSSQPFHHFLEIIGRLYKTRDRILESADRLKDYSYSLEKCGKVELSDIRSKINTEIYKIISDVNELTPTLSNPEIIDSINERALKLNTGLNNLDSDEDYRSIISKIVRNDFCPIVLMTRLELTPKSIKKAYNIEIGMRDVIQLKGLFEHHQDNY